MKYIIPSDKVWRGAAWWNADYSCWQGITECLTGAHDERIVILPAADHDALVAALAEAERELVILKKKCNNSLANNLCSDHRDKQDGKPCLACDLAYARAELAHWKRPAETFQDKAARYDGLCD